MLTIQPQPTAEELDAAKEELVQEIVNKVLEVRLCVVLQQPYLNQLQIAGALVRRQCQQVLKPCICSQHQPAGQCVQAPDQPTELFVVCPLLLPRCIPLQIDGAVVEQVRHRAMWHAGIAHASESSRDSGRQWQPSD